MIMFTVFCKAVLLCFSFIGESYLLADKRLSLNLLIILSEFKLINSIPLATIRKTDFLLILGGIEVS